MTVKEIAEMDKPRISSEVRRAVDRTILFLGGETSERRKRLVDILGDWAALYAARFPKDNDREVRIAWIEAICDYWDRQVALYDLDLGEINFEEEEQ